VNAPSSVVEEARAMVSAPTLADRTEVASLAQSVAASALREASPDERAKLLRLSAELRVRSFRAHHVEADAHEALTLLSDAARLVRGKEAGCEAEIERAELVGELRRDAGVAWKELTLAKLRSDGLDPESPCLRALDQKLARLGAYRLTGEALAELERHLRDSEPVKPSPSAAVPSASATVVAAPPDADVVVSPSTIKPSTDPVKVTKIDTYPAENGGRVVLHLSGPTSFSAGALDKDATASKDPRIYVDIDKARVKGVKREIDVGGAIRRVRVAPRGEGARVVLDLREALSRKVYYLPEPFRIVIDTSNKPLASPTSGPPTIKRVVIDPGHGGHDSGAIGPTGLTEKEVALDVARRAATLLSTELNVETLLTRDDDVFVPLEERTARANSFHADLFISIHCNASENGDARGVEVFVLEEGRDAKRADARIAALENGLRGKSLDSGLDAEMASIAGRLRSGEIATASRRLGLLLGKSTMASLGERYPDTTDHGLKSAGFYVLMGAEMPATLFETSFISNPTDEGRLAKADYRQNLADAVANAVRAYREGK
jgi:N-acetylmuramoyl-L-alanine amidase